MKLELNQTYSVTISKIMERGAVVTVAGQEGTGFIHISEISDRYVTAIAEFVSVGETYDATCIDTAKCGFSLKPLHLQSRVRNIPEQRKEKQRKEFIKKEGNLSLDEMIARANASLADKQRYKSQPRQSRPGKRKNKGRNSND